ncbi:MAG: amidohydrolase [Dehalococcoidia bacterium]|nr:MAG: amidohydrolase [Dehalococcoidia bacterium]
MNLPDVRPAVRALSDETIAVRRDLHRHAELSTEEHRTQKVILDHLLAIGADDARACADTGATALVRGELPGPNLLWRADIDALPLQEETGLPFACDGAKAMHACGHDGHVAIALAMASALQRSRASLAGSVRFAFQPAEEHVGGARRMIDEGVMSSPVVDRVFGFHIWAPARVGQAVVTAGPVFAASTHFRIIIRGQGGHASAPHTAVDPIVVAAHAVVALQTVVSRAVNPEETAVLTIGRIQGGVRGNIIPNEVMMSGTIRTFERDVEQRVVERATQVLAGVTAAWGATFQFDTSTLPAVVNDPACAALAAGAAAAFLGAENVVEGRTTGGDDMAYFLERAPGAYIMLGGWNPERGAAWPHHHPKFDFDERCLDLGVELGLRIIEAAAGRALA